MNMQETATLLPSEEQLRRRLEQLHEKSKDTVGALLNMELVSCRPEDNSCLLHADTQGWMRNTNGTLHGGIGATLLDHAMGALVYALGEEGSVCPTMQMQTYYHRPLAPGKDILAEVTVTARTRRFFYTAARIYQADAPDRVCISGSAIYVLQENRP